MKYPKYQRISLFRRRLLFVLFVGLFVLFFYTFLHEAGHAAAGLLFGGTLNSFSLNFLNLSAHVGLSGTFSAYERSIINLSGTALPFLVWAVFMLFVPRQANPVLELLKTISSASLLGSLLPWVLIPLVYFGGIAPAGEDVTQFLNNSRLHPLATAGLFLGVFCASAGLFAARSGGVSRNLKQIGDWLRSPSQEPYSAGIQTTLAALCAILILLAALALGMTNFLS